MDQMIRPDFDKLSRRKFIVGSAAVAGGGLALGLRLGDGFGSAEAASAAKAAAAKEGAD